MTERAKKLLLLYCKQGGKIRRVSGLPLLTFKAKKAGTLNNYRIYGNTETKTRSYSGSAPLSFPIEDGAVSNYRVYGNTVNGESVGDKTANILPLSRTPITETHGDFLCEYDGLGTITLTTDKDNATTDGEFVIPLIHNFTVPVSVGQGGTGCLQINNSVSLSGLGGGNGINLYYNDQIVEYWNLTSVNRITSSYTNMGNKTINTVSVVITNGGSSRKITIKPAFVENVTEQVPFEPYGYRIPITNNSETANIYLDEPLRKVGDEAEYIDYAEQKQHRVRKNLLQNTATSRTINGVTFTVNSDGSIVCDGQTSSSTATLIFSNFLVPSGTYILTGCPNGGSEIGTYKMLLFINGAWFANDMGSGANFTLTETSTVSVRIDIYNGYTCNNLTFYPMIRKADIEDDTYEPYIENTEVDVTLPALPAQSSTNSLSVGTVVQPSSVAVDVDEVVSCGDRTENLFDGTFIHRSVIETTVCNDNPNRRSIVVDISNFNNGDKITFSRETGVGNVFQMYQVTSPLEGGRLLNTNVISGDSETLLATITLDKISNYHYLIIFLNGATNIITDEELLASKIMVNVGNTPLPYEPYGYKVPVTVKGKNLFDETYPSIVSNTIKYKSIYVGDGQFTLSTTASVYSGTTVLFLLAGIAAEGSDSATNGVHANRTRSVASIDGYVTIAYRIRGTIDPRNYNTMLNAGSTPLPYEPYHTPVTTPIYLPEQIRKVGDEAEYIDYAKQKQHRVRKNYFQSSDFEAGAIFTGQGWKDLTYQNSKTPPGQTDLGGVVFYTTRKRSTNLITIIGTYTISIADGWEFGIVMFPNDRNSSDLFIYNTEPVTISNCTFAIQLRKTDVSNISSADISDYKIMLNKGSTPLPYEPYIENVDLDVTLPAIPTLTGTNVLSVGTEVQPSGVEIKGRIKAAGGD